MKPKIVPITLLALTLGILFDYLFIGKTPGISVLLYTALILGGTLYLSEIFHARLPRTAYLLMPVILFFALMVVIRASEMLLFFNVVLIIYLLLLLAQIIRQPGKPLHEYSIAQYFTRLARLPLHFLREAVLRLRAITGSRHDSAQRAAYVPYLRGLAISLPIVVILLMLLASADLVLQRYLTSIFDFQLDLELVFRILLVTFITSLFIGAYALLFMNPPISDTESENKSPVFKLGTVEASIILGSVAALFLMFIAIQITYFFGGTDQVMNTEFTYAEYARRGFFELITVAVISMLLVFTLKKSTLLHDRRQTMRFKILSSVLIAEVLVIMLSAHMRLSLYEEAYGFTALRLFSHLFVLWLAVALVMLLAYIIRGHQEQWLAFRLFISVLTFFAVLNFINPDAFIARQNIDRFNRTGKLDTFYLTRLSPDAIPVTIKLLDSRDAEVKAEVTQRFFIQKELNNCLGRPWQSFNISYQQALDTLNSKSEQLDASGARFHCTQPVR